MSQLELLGLDRNRVTDVAPLAGHTLMLRLVLYDNAITDIGPLADLENLQLLDLGLNSVPDLSPLSEIYGMLIIGLERTTVTDLDPLREMVELNTIVLDNNRDLTDIEPLLDNPGVGRDDIVQLTGTSVSCEDIALLEERRVTVMSECS